MSGFVSLQETVERATRRFPERPALDDPGVGVLSYGVLATLSDRVRDRLAALGTRPGDRVGVYLPKSADAVAAILGILKLGAAYVPVDPGSPPWRAAYILENCSVQVAFVFADFVAPLNEELTKLGSRVALIELPEVGAGRGLTATLDRLGVAPVVPTRQSEPDDLAYILYTSGSTGKPKGVMLSQVAAMRFVNWCSGVFQPTEQDRFSSHAPFHFDLSIFDLYVSLKHGALLVLIGEELGKDPLTLAQLIAEKRLTIWYSTPSILSLLGQYGKLERHDLSSLRHVLFAGEVFPIPQFRRVKDFIPGPRYWNLYGPTETNVCTYYEVPATIADDRVDPFPIGPVCEHYVARVVDQDGQTVPFGEEGELLIAGDGVMTGYWNLPENNERAFLIAADGTRWYHTGDLVVEDREQGYIFHGRRDRMVKRRGYRVELGEIEAGLATHPGVREVAVIAIPDQASGVKIKAFLAPRNGTKLGIVELKQYCMDRLPKYMSPDLFGFVAALPRTSTDKIDYQALKTLA